MSSSETPRGRNHTIELTIGEEDLLALTDHVERTAPVVEAYRKRNAEHGDAILRNQLALGDRFSTIVGVADRLRALSNGTYPERPTMAVQYGMVLNGNDDPGGPLQTATMDLVGFLLSFECAATDRPSRWPWIDDDAARSFAATARDLRALCGGSARPEPPPARVGGNPTPMSAVHPLDEAAARLRRDKKPTRAALVEFMRGKTSASREEIAHHVHGDPEITDNGIAQNCARTNDDLIEMGVPIAFRFASGSVHKVSTAE